MKLLVVDDHTPIRELMKGLVGDLFVEVFESSDGAEAVSSYSEHQPDWVLMDIRMKTMSGLAATARIKRSHPGARIIVVTNHDAPELRVAARQAGAWDFVPKDNLHGLRQLITSGISSDLAPAATGIA